MAAFFQTTFTNTFSWIRLFKFRLDSLKFVPKGPIENIAALFLIMAWRRTGDKPLSEPTVHYVADAYMRHSASMS